MLRASLRMLGAQSGFCQDVISTLSFYARRNKGVFIFEDAVVSVTLQHA